MSQLISPELAKSIIRDGVRCGIDQFGIDAVRSWAPDAEAAVIRWFEESVRNGDSAVINAIRSLGWAYAAEAYREATKELERV